MGDEFNASYVGLRHDLLTHVCGFKNDVLDVGCATGSNGEFLLRKGIADRVVGIECDSRLAAVASTILSNTVVGDVEDEQVLDEALGFGPYDYVLCGDVLEHLYNPWHIVYLLGNALKNDGRLIVSLPNIQHVDVLLHVFIKGYWPYNERGIFDKTHLRWFTIKNIYELVEEGELEIVTLERKFRYRDKKASKFPWYGSILKSVFPNYYTFQYVVVCKKQ